MKRFAYTLLLSLVVSILFLTSCDKTSDEIHESSSIYCCFVNKTGDNITPERIENLLEYGVILQDKYSIRSTVNGIEMKKPVVEYYPEKGEIPIPAFINLSPGEVWKVFVPKDKKLDIEIFIKFPALFQDEETHNIKYSVNLLAYGGVRMIINGSVYFDQEQCQSFLEGNYWRIKLNN